MKKVTNVLLVTMALFVMCSCSTTYIRGGVQTNMIGPDVGGALSMNLGGYGDLYSFTDRTKIDLDTGVEMFVYDGDKQLQSGDYSGNDIAIAIYTGPRLVHTRGDWSFFVGGGAQSGAGYGDYDGLAHSNLYGTITVGVKYKKLSLGVRHISSPFHGGEDGDLGVNLFTAEWEFPD